MEQMINQINHFNLHLLQPNANNNRNLKKTLVNSSMLQQSKDETLLKIMSKFANLASKKYEFLYLKFLCRKKGNWKNAHTFELVFKKY